MKIYTKTGDAGETSLIYGTRVPKDDVCVDTYGTVDEANSVLGVAVSLLAADEPTYADLRNTLLRVQRDLFDIGRDLATPADKRVALYVTPRQTQYLEKSIDQLDAEVPPLRQFILPGGHMAAAYLHLARTVVRRAERLMVSVLRDQTSNPEIGKYLNRLSDLLFVAARVVNHRSGIVEPVVDFQAKEEETD